MNKQIEALKMAIEQLESWHNVYVVKPSANMELLDFSVALNACKEALEEAEKQEPVGYSLGISVNRLVLEKSSKHPTQEPVPLIRHKNGNFSPKHTHPAKQLSDDEIKDVWFKLYPLNDNNLWADMFAGKHLSKFARAIEAKIRGE